MTKPAKSYYSMRSYLSYMRRYKRQAAIIFTSFLIADGLLAIVPLFIGKLVGSLAAQPLQTHNAITYVWLLIFCSVGHDLVWHFSEFLYLNMVNRASYDYETVLFRQIIQKPYPYFVDKFTGKIASYITTISQELHDFTQNFFYEYASQLVNLVSIIIILTIVNWRTGLVFAIGLLLMVVIGRQTIRNSTKYEKQLADVQSTKNGKIIDAIANFVNIKSFRREAAETQGLKDEQEITIRASRKSFIWNLVFWSSLGLVVRVLIWPLTITLNVYLFLHHQISIGALTTFLSAVLLFSTTIWDLIWQLSQFNLKASRIEEAHTYLFGNTNIIQQSLSVGDHAVNERHFRHTLSLRQLNFAYPDKPDVNVLTDINLNIKQSERVGIVGKSGGGKTTITKLLLGYYPVTNGQIILDDELIDTRNLAELISYVPQDTSLFHRSIADNIAYATDKAAGRDDVVEAAKRAHADEFIIQTSNGYDTLVGERGVKLSAGQRQRIAIARAFLDDKPILVLDEATSALDSESEILVQQALEKLWHDKTVIAIAHRLSTLRHMDKIIVVDKGKIIEQGSHDELIAKKGKYASLWSHQSGGFLEE